MQRKKILIKGRNDKILKVKVLTIAFVGYKAVLPRID